MRREIEKLARNVGVPDSTLQGERLRAVPFWAAVHDLTSHTGALVSAVDEFDSDRERMQGMVRGMIEVYVQWAEQFEIAVHESVRRLLAEWDLAAAWTVLCPTIRHWAGGLLDDGFGVYGVGSSDAVPAARALVNNGVDSYMRVAGALPAASRSATKLAHI